jgi:hypothetical protein
MNVARDATTNGKHAIGKARMQKLLKTGTFSSFKNSMAKFPKRFLQASNVATVPTTKARMSQGTCPTSFANSNRSTPTVVSDTQVVSARKPARVIKASKASVKKG